MIIRKVLAKLFAAKFYPTNKQDWYKLKDYKGNNHEQRFQDFIIKQQQQDAHFYHEFQNIKITRQFITSKDELLDSVTLTPLPQAAKHKPGSGMFFIMIQGRGEYYESRFREMAIQARETGASIVGYNPKGFHSSSGKTQILNDLVDDSIAIINSLLVKQIKPENIILQGNSLGGAIAEMTFNYFAKNHQIKFRQINSNSFSSLASVLAHRNYLPFMSKIISKILAFSNWEIIPGPSFTIIGPYRLHLRRNKDRTILPSAKYHSIIDYKKSHNNCPKSYIKIMEWLYNNSLLTYYGNSIKDPHKLGLHEFKIPECDDNGEHKSIYYLINKYLAASLHHIENQ